MFLGRLNRATDATWLKNRGAEVATRWTVTRTGNRVRIDVTNAAGFGETDTKAISNALMDYLVDDEVRVIHLNGPVLMEEGSPDGLGDALRRLGNLARDNEKRLEVGPI
jgi:hypothetical protein